MAWKYFFLCVIQYWKVQKAKLHFQLKGKAFRVAKVWIYPLYIEVLVGVAEFAALVQQKATGSSESGARADQNCSSQGQDLITQEPSYKFRSELRIFLKWTLQKQLIGDTWLCKTEIWWFCSLGFFFPFFSLFLPIY